MAPTARLFGLLGRGWGGRFGFFDFFSPRDPLHAYGVYERDMPARYVAAIEEIAARWSKTSSLVEEERWHGRHRDCQIADD